MKIPLVNSNNQVEMVKLHDIIFTAVEDDRLVYHTTESKYYPINTLKSAAEFLSIHGLETINHEQVARLDMVIAYDPKTNEAVFIGGKRCAISRRQKHKLRRVLRRPH